VIHYILDINQKTFEDNSLHRAFIEYYFSQVKTAPQTRYHATDENNIMSRRHSSGKPDRAFTKKWIFESEEFREVAFIVGAARKNNLFPRNSLFTYEADNPCVF
jgi:hypothetical protein